MNDTAMLIWNTVSPFLFRVIFAIVLYYIGQKVIKLILSLLTKLGTKKLEAGVLGFLHTVLNVILQVVLVIAVVDTLGFPTTSFIAVIGSLGLTVGLALQGSLSNFAGGVLLLVTKPFVVGDYISVSGYEGTVSEIGICYTKLKTVDNRVVVLPNGSLSNSNLVNVNQEQLRRVDLVVPVSYSDDITGVKDMLLDIAHANPLVLQDQPVDVFVKGFGNDSVDVSFRVWTNRETYWDVFGQIQEAVHKEMPKRGYTIPFHQVDVTIVSEQK